jgi:hypothetical protein
MERAPVPGDSMKRRIGGVAANDRPFVIVRSFNNMPPSFPSHSSFRILVPATTANLGPGFDCLGMALSLYNEIEVMPLDASPDSADIVEIEGEGALELPCDDRNMIV